MRRTEHFTREEREAAKERRAAGIAYWRTLSRETLHDIVGDDLDGYEAALSEAEREIAELSQQLEFDRTAVADCSSKANRAIDSRHWLTEGRGSYEWNDDRWHDEFRCAAIEIKDSLAPLTKIAANWQHCPKTTEAVSKARVDLKAENQRLREQLEAANKHVRALYQGICSYCGGPLNHEKSCQNQCAGNGRD